MPRWVETIVRELWALFVDDFGLAVSAALWVVIVWLAVKLGAPSGVMGPLLFLGLAAALMISVGRRTRRKD